jgi:uncharacterized UBP type Zn finger protein
MPFLRSKIEICEHTPASTAQQRAEACEGCGSTFNLRLCAECGFVGCCESQQAHDRTHALEAGHPVIKSLPLSEGSFTWCYSCGRYV